MEKVKYSPLFLSDRSLNSTLMDSLSLFKCCCGLRIFCVFVFARVVAHAQTHAPSVLFPQSYQCLFSDCEKPIAPAFFACQSVTKIYCCVYPVNTSNHYVNWLQRIAAIIVTAGALFSLTFVLCIFYSLLSTHPSSLSFFHCDPLQLFLLTPPPPLPLLLFVCNCICVYECYDYTMDVNHKRQRCDVA